MIATTAWRGRRRSGARFRTGCGDGLVRCTVAAADPFAQPMRKRRPVETQTEDILRVPTSEVV